MESRTAPSALSSSNMLINETTTSQMTLLCRKIYASISAIRASSTASTNFSGIGRYQRLDRKRRERSEDVEDVKSDRSGGKVVVEEESEEEEKDALVNLKVSLMGDCQIGKTSFVIKYVGDDEKHHTCLEMNGLNLTAKTFLVQWARIAFKIWDVGDSHPDIDWH
ncbi:hypothetical protein AKJ16_DCAP26739 [Drosera capensis]